MTGGSWLCLLSPLAGAMLITLCGRRIPRVAAAWIATTSCFVAFGGAIWAFFGVHGQPTKPGITPEDVALPRGELTTAWTWLQSGNFHAGLQLLVDPLSVVMMLIVSGVGGLIVLYSIGYMDGDDEERRYFAYISFFVCCSCSSAGAWSGSRPTC
jgi:NADH-quinone oxidoreductase subunit L